MSRSEAARLHVYDPYGGSDFPVLDSQKAPTVSRLIRDALVESTFRTPEAEKKLEDTRSIEIRRDELALWLRKCLDGKLDHFSPDMTADEYHEIEQAIIDFYFLTIPYFHTKEAPIMMAQKRTGLQALENEERVWCSLPNCEHLFGTYVDKTTLIFKAVREHIKRIQNPNIQESEAQVAERRSCIIHGLFAIKFKNGSKSLEDPATAERIFLADKIVQIIEHPERSKQELQDIIEDIDELLSTYPEKESVSAPDSEHLAVFVDVFKNIRFSGLPDHHAIMSRFMIHSVQSIQAHIRMKMSETETPQELKKTQEFSSELTASTPLQAMKKSTDELAKPQTTQEQQKQIWESILSINPYILGVYALLHDAGRTITHDFEGHERESYNLAIKANIDPLYAIEPSSVHLLTGELPPERMIDIATGYMTSKMDQTKKYEGLLALLVHYFDFFGKADQPDPASFTRSGVRLPNEIDRIFQSQDAKYKNDASKRNDRRKNYSIYEASLMTRISWFMRDTEVGLGLDESDIFGWFAFLQDTIVPNVRKEYRTLQY